MNNNDIRNISKNFFRVILPNYMTFFKPNYKSTKTVCSDFSEWTQYCNGIIFLGKTTTKCDNAYVKLDL